jgi:hypothetical protein
MFTAAATSAAPALQLARLVAVEQQRVAGEAELSEAQEQVQRAQEESFAMMRRSQEHHRCIEQLESSLAAAKQEVKQLKASHSDAANFLLLCLADVRQDMQTGRAVQQAGKLAVQQQQQPIMQQQQQQECGGIEEMPCADGSPSAVTAPEAEPSVGHGQPAVLLAELSLQQRQAVLAKLLRTVRGGEWLEGEGVTLPISTSHSSRSVGLLSAASASQLSLQASASAKSLEVQRSGRRVAAGCMLQSPSSLSCGSSAGCLDAGAVDSGGGKQLKVHGPAAQRLTGSSSKCRPPAARLGAC